MSRPYAVDGRDGRLYAVPQFGRPTVYRGNRLAAGMAFTAARSRRSARATDNLSDDARRLVVYGTTAKAIGTRFLASHGVCPCCGSRTGPLRLNEHGQLALAKLRRTRAARRNADG